MKKHKQKHKHIDKDIGLALVVGSFAIAFFATAPVVFELNNQVVRTMFAIHSSIDADRDGISDLYDGKKNRDFTSEDVARSVSESKNVATPESEE